MVHATSGVRHLRRRAGLSRGGVSRVRHHPEGTREHFEENLEAIKRLWTEDVVDMVGSHFTLKGASVPTKPVQKPYPP